MSLDEPSERSNTCETPSLSVTVRCTLERRHDGYHSPSPVDADLACRPGVSDADVGADRAHRGARTGAPRPAWRGAHGGRGTDPAVFRRHRGSPRNCPALASQRNSWPSCDRGSSPARSTCSRVAARWCASRGGGWRSDRARARATALARADRQRAQRDPHAGLHPAPGGADRARDSATSCSSGRAIPRARSASRSS